MRQLLQKSKTIYEYVLYLKEVLHSTDESSDRNAEITVKTVEILQSEGFSENFSVNRTCVSLVAFTFEQVAVTVAGTTQKVIDRVRDDSKYKVQ